jgi:hypothetical protein
MWCVLWWWEGGFLKYLGRGLSLLFPSEVESIYKCGPLPILEHQLSIKSVAALLFPRPRKQSFHLFQQSDHVIKMKLHGLVEDT